MVEYVIASQCLFPAINTLIQSDHCIIQFSVILHDSVLDAESDNNSGSSCNYKYVWKNNKVESYKNALHSKDEQGTLNDLKANISNLTKEVNGSNNYAIHSKISAIVK